MEERKRNKPIKYGVDIHIRISTETFEKIQEISQKNCVTYSEMIRRLIENAINSYK